MPNWRAIQRVADQPGRGRVHEGPGDEQDVAGDVALA